MPPPSWPSRPASVRSRRPGSGTHTRPLRHPSSEEAGRVALEAVSAVAGRDASREPELFWEEFGGSSINLVVRFWIPFHASNADYLNAKNDAIVALKRAFDAENVGIPYPITTLDFDNVGGWTLGDELKVLADG